MTNTNTLPAPVDTLAGFSMPQRYELERTYRFDGEVVRVKVVRDSGKMQCWGNVSVLADDRAWTTLTTALRDEVYDTDSPYAFDGGDVSAWAELQLASVADRLIRRAMLILGVKA